MVETVVQDLRQGLRLVRRSPSLAFAGIGSLAVGIGASISMFILVNAVLFRPLPLRSPERLVFLFHGTEENPYSSLSYPDYVDYRDEAPFELAAYSEIAVSLSDGAEPGPELVRGLIATGNFFEVLGASPFRGRLFTPADDRIPGEHPVVVLSHGLWRRRFGGEPVVGRDIEVNGRSYVVLGIAPEGFRGPEVLESYDVYLPMAMQAHARPPRAGFSSEMNPDLLSRRGASWLRGIGRLAPGSSMEEAEASLVLISRRLEANFPDTNERERASLFPLSRVDPRAYSALRAIAGLLMGVGALVLLVATANVTSLLLARALSRRREIAVRRSLGGSRARLVRQMLTESAVLAALGAALGLLLASWTIEGLSRLVPPSGIFSFTLDFEIDSRVLALTVLVALVASFLVGLAPALQASRHDLVSSIRDPDGGALGRRGRLGGRNALVLAQLALSMILLVGAALFTESFRRSASIAPGFAADEILAVDLRLDLLRYSRPRGRDLYRQIVERVSSLSGVRSASLVRSVPLAGAGRTTALELEGVVETEERVVATNVVGLDYFRTMGIELLSGRDFSPLDDEGSTPVAIASESFASRYFPSGALGRRVRLDSEDSPFREIVGVVRDSKIRRLGEDPTPHLYQPLAQQHETGMVLLVRTEPAPEVLAAAVRKAVLSLEPDLPVSGVQPLSALLSSSLFPARMGARLLAAFAALALALAAVGLYGVTAFAVSRRKRELGIRVALGARPRELVRLVVGDALLLVGLGVALGTLAALASTRLVAGFLFGVSPSDPGTFVVVGMVLCLVMLATSYAPAHRAARSDPLSALRHE